MRLLAKIGINNMKTELELIWECYLQYLEESKKQQRLVDMFINYNKTPRDATLGKLRNLLDFYKNGQYKFSFTKSGFKVEDSKDPSRMIAAHSDKNNAAVLDPRIVYHVKNLLTGKPITN